MHDAGYVSKNLVKAFRISERCVLHMGPILILIVVAFAFYMMGPLLIIAIVVGVCYLLYLVYKSLEESVSYNAEEKKKERRKRVEAELDRRIGFYKRQAIAIENALSQYTHANEDIDQLNSCIQEDNCQEMGLSLKDVSVYSEWMLAGRMSLNDLEKQRDYCQKKISQIEKEKAMIMSAESDYLFERIYKDLFAEEDKKRQKEVVMLLVKKYVKRAVVGLAVIALLIGIVKIGNYIKTQMQHTEAGRVADESELERAVRIYDE